MKILLLLMFLGILMTSCMTPTEQVIITEKFFDKKTGKIEREVITDTVKYEVSYFGSCKVLGFEVKPYDPVTKTFSLKALYGHMENARIHKEQTFHSDFGFKDISLFTGSGSAYQSFYVGPKDNKSYYEYLSGQISNKKNVNTKIKNE